MWREVIYCISILLCISDSCWSMRADIIFSIIPVFELLFKSSHASLVQQKPISDVANLVTDAKFRYDYTFVKPIEGWLKVHPVPATFFDAFLRCDFEGAVLASPSTELLRKALVAVHPYSNNTCGIYTGIHSTISPGDFTTIEGLPIERIPVKWADDEPDRAQDQEDCVIMLPDGKLADVACNETFPYVCYKKKTKNLVVTECGTSDPAYKLDSRTGSCYKFHKDVKTWRRAQMTCIAEGGHLAVINSQAEAEVIKGLFAQNPPNLISSPYKDSVALGFLHWGTDGGWYTVHGQKLTESGYSAWAANAPDNAKLNGMEQRCGGAFRTGLLDDIWCDNVNFAFICEKAPESLISDEEARK